ncbi:hypothetical protein [Sphingomonas panaciterrae]|uniref:hypothetical protein n=1 Tax=Sphingomonas panaciterrae TaxID=1462999 RepID=UPI002FF06449
MTDDRFMLNSGDDLRFYEERARQEKAAAEAATSAEAASAHRLLAIEYEAHARELRDRQAEQTNSTSDRGAPVSQGMTFAQRI